jgi:hypothetical protein
MTPPVGGGFCEAAVMHAGLASVTGGEVRSRDLPTNLQWPLLPMGGYVRRALLGSAACRSAVIKEKREAL